jgi:hypothetical protein
MVKGYLKINSERLNLLNVLLNMWHKAVIYVKFKNYPVRKFPFMIAASFMASYKIERHTIIR